MPMLQGKDTLIVKAKYIKDKIGYLGLFVQIKALLSDHCIKWSRIKTRNW